MYVLQAKGRTALILRPSQSIWKRVLLLAWVIWLLDVCTKTWALSSLEGRAELKILGNFLTLTLAKNSGAAFSLGSNGTLFLTLFSMLVIFLVGYWMPRVTSRRWATVLALVLGGSLGNVTDRIFRTGDGLFRGHVIDWISLPHWPIFNLADSAIVIAAVYAAYLSYRNVAPRSPQLTDKKGDGESHGT